ncbi:MAG: site-specific integrase [Synechococcus sp. YX04-3]|nr:MAG: site-specific integrase [Synechococcus sp. YX04-3]
MPISTDKEIQELSQMPKTTTRSCGDNLYVIWRPSVKKGGLYLTGRIRRKLAGKWTLPDCHIGRYGKGTGELSLKKARTKWMEVQKWCEENKVHPADYHKQEKLNLQSAKTLKDAINGFLEEKEQSIKPATFKEYRNKLNNTVLGIIPADTTLKELEWDEGGRSIVQSAIKQITSGSKFDLGSRCQKLLFQTFNYAISEGWMKRGSNPAERLSGDTSPTSSGGHHPTIDWNCVPKLIEDIQFNRSNTHIQAVMATKMMLMTFLRAGCLCRLEWEWISKDLITIPGTTEGLKRRKGKSEHIPHLVPITPQMKQMLRKLEQLNGKDKYLFLPLRESRYEHLDPSSPNNYLKNIGYKDVLRAHGWRSVATTAGVDELGFDYEVIEKCLGHLPKEKVRKAYDKSLRLEERRDFMNQWNSLLVKKGLKV